MNEKCTIYDVARVAGVSPGTVSKVINGNGGSQSTRAKVLESAQSLGYRPNMYASAMRAELKKCIGILVSKIRTDNPWLEKLLSEMTFAVSKAGYRCMVDFWSESLEDIPGVLDSVDGCILLGNYPDDFFRVVEEKIGLPLVTYDEKMPYKKGKALTVDWNLAMQKSVQYLLAHQHQHIGLVMYGSAPALQARHRGFIEAMEHFGRGVDHGMIAAEQGGRSPGGGLVENFIGTGRDLTAQLLKKRPEVTAIVYSADVIAFGGIQALREHGYALPEDMSIVGIDNTDWCRVMTPPLTSAGADYVDLCFRLIETLESLIGLRPVFGKPKLEPHLVKRDSVAAPRALKETAASRGR